MTELFEVISEDEFVAETSSGASLADQDGTRSATLPPVNVAGASGVTMTYCEFCKGYYIAEYHFGDTEGGE